MYGISTFFNIGHLEGKFATGPLKYSVIFKRLRVQITYPFGNSEGIGCKSHMKKYANVHQFFMTNCDSVRSSCFIGLLG
jgi:hypothetical protein